MITLVLVAGIAASVGSARADESDSAFWALACPVHMQGTHTWDRLDFDGASRRVKPFLSSLGSGEQGTGVIVSPEFAIAGDQIVLTVRGHDGQGGGKGKNFVALVDAENGAVLKRTPAPGQDALKEVAWDVSALQGRRVRIEAHDGLDEAAFAWMGIGTIDAGSAFSVDFKTTGPEGWTRRAERQAVRKEEPWKQFTGGVPFQTLREAYSIVPPSGKVTIPCGFAAQRLFFLGCTVPGGTPGAEYGTIRLDYADGTADAIPLVYGFTLEGTLKQLSPSEAMWLHPSADVFQFYLVVAPEAKPIREIVIETREGAPGRLRFTGVTCQTGAKHENLTPLPAPELAPAEQAWIRTHAIRPGKPSLDEIRSTLRKDHDLP